MKDKERYYEGGYDYANDVHNQHQADVLNCEVAWSDEVELLINNEEIKSKHWKKDIFISKEPFFKKLKELHKTMKISRFDEGFLLKDNGYFPIETIVTDKQGVEHNIYIKGTKSQVSIGAIEKILNS